MDNLFRNEQGAIDTLRIVSITVIEQHTNGGEYAVRIQLNKNNDASYFSGYQTKADATKVMNQILDHRKAYKARLEKMNAEHKAKIEENRKKG